MAVNASLTSGVENYSRNKVCYCFLNIILIPNLPSEKLMTHTATVANVMG